MLLLTIISTVASSRHSARVCGLVKSCSFGPSCCRFREGLEIFQGPLNILLGQFIILELVVIEQLVSVQVHEPVACSPTVKSLAGKPIARAGE